LDLPRRQPRHGSVHPPGQLQHGRLPSRLADTGCA
jgi:hypothetical protein